MVGAFATLRKDHRPIFQVGGDDIEIEVHDCYKDDGCFQVLLMHISRFLKRIFDWSGMFGIRFAGKFERCRGWGER